MDILGEPKANPHQEPERSGSGQKKKSGMDPIEAAK
jgi:hypothetical protein